MQFDPTYQLTHHRIGGTCALPKLAVGNLTLALALPDARQQVLDHRSSIRLANADTEWLVVGKRVLTYWAPSLCPNEKRRGRGRREVSIDKQFQKGFMVTIARIY